MIPGVLGGGGGGAEYSYERAGGDDRKLWKNPQKGAKRNLHRF